MGWGKWPNIEKMVQNNCKIFKKKPRKKYGEVPFVLVRENAKIIWPKTFLAMLWLLFANKCCFCLQPLGCIKSEYNKRKASRVGCGKILINSDVNIQRGQTKLQKHQL